MQTSENSVKTKFAEVAFYSGSRCSWPTPQTIGLAREWAA